VLQVEAAHASHDSPAGVTERGHEPAQPVRTLTSSSVEPVEDQCRPTRTRPLTQNIGEIVVQAEARPGRSYVVWQILNSEYNHVLVGQAACQVVKHSRLAGARGTDKDDITVDTHEIIGGRSGAVDNAARDGQGGVIGEGSQRVVADLLEDPDVNRVAGGRTEGRTEVVEVNRDVGSAAPQPLHREAAPELDEVVPSTVGVCRLEQGRSQIHQGGLAVAFAVSEIQDVYHHHS
jgi:hypothetical protein